MFLKNKFGIDGCVSSANVPEEGNHFFKAGKVLPSTGRICTRTEQNDCIPVVSTGENDGNGKEITRSASSVRNDNFTAIAAGYIFSWKDDAEAKADQWIINEKKELLQIQMGY